LALVDQRLGVTGAEPLSISDLLEDRDDFGKAKRNLECFNLNGVKESTCSTRRREDRPGPASKPIRSEPSVHRCSNFS
jgi:hypothetical protein